MFLMSRKTFRTEEFEEYKAQRAAMPDDLRSQISMAVQAEDENSLKNLFSQLNTLNDKLKAAEVNFQKELATLPSINCKINNAYATNVMPRSRRNYKELARL